MPQIARPRCSLYATNHRNIDSLFAYVTRHRSNQQQQQPGKQRLEMEQKTMRSTSSKDIRHIVR